MLFCSNVAHIYNMLLACRIDKSKGVKGQEARRRSISVRSRVIIDLGIRHIGATEDAEAERSITALG